MTLRTDRFKVGVFLAASGALFLFFLAFVVGRTLLREESSYLIRFEETVKGLNAGAQVNFHGVPVGSVSGMNLEGRTTVVRIRVDPAKAVVQAGVTRAALERNPVTGLATVELEGWEEGGAELAEEGVIPADPSWSSEVLTTFPRLLRETSEALRGITAAAAAVRGLLDEAFQIRVKTVLSNLDDLSKRLPEAVEGLSREGGQALAAAREAAERLAAAAQELSRTATDLAGDTRGALAEAREAAAELRGLARDGRALLGGGKVDELLAAAARLEKEAAGTLAQLRLAAQGLEGSLGTAARGLMPLLERLQVAAGEISRLAGLLGDNPASLIWADPRRERPIPDPPAGGRRE